MGKGDEMLELYGRDVFSDSAMRKYLPGDTYKQLRKTIDLGRPMDPALADNVANGMKRWALDKGATHYTHWFQPMTGYTAEKHDSFINPRGDGIILSFSGKELVRGEADASSFPSGGMRATFEARGYTTWDCTSPAFVKNNTLYIPTCFCAFNGEVLDKKTPLLRSMDALDLQAKRVLKCLGYHQVERVVPMAGAEQEYFLVDKEEYVRRRDLMLCGRTLFGAPPPKGQELDDHYYGNIKDRVIAYMREVDQELWALGVSAKTEHKEVAPQQHELAPVYTTANIACDNNQLIMETLQKVALRHNMVCLLHEKPFAGVNGSGKHNNWSVTMNGWENLLDQGKTPESNARFLLMLAAVIWGVDEYGDMLRCTVAGPGNDHRLGGNEAPPAILSLSLGDMLTDLLTEVETGGSSVLRQGGSLQIGVNALPVLPKDVADRNRTSPMAFTGNKFEVRMLGSSMSIADCNTVLNTMMAEILSRMADRLETAEDVNAEVTAIIRQVMREHKRIIFNGNNYSEEWKREAANRGLPISNNSVDAFKAWVEPKNVELFRRHGIMAPKEMEAGYQIRLENYINTVRIEAHTMIEMAHKDLIPALVKYTRRLADVVNAVKDTGLAADITLEAGMLKEVCAGSAQLSRDLTKLEKVLDNCVTTDGLVTRAQRCRDKLVPAMEALRKSTDRLEPLVGQEYWPMPDYTALLFGMM